MSFHVLYQLVYEIMSIHNHLFLMFLLSLATEYFLCCTNYPCSFLCCRFVFYVCCCRCSCAWASVLQLSAYKCSSVLLHKICCLFGPSVIFLVPAASNTLKLENRVDCS
ncbi:hypothetical protein BsWGS_08096 [Bradybaena similaris]